MPAPAETVIPNPAPAPPHRQPTLRQPTLRQPAPRLSRSSFITFLVLAVAAGLAFRPIAWTPPSAEASQAMEASVVSQVEASEASLLPVVRGVALSLPGAEGPALHEASGAYSGGLATPPNPFRFQQRAHGEGPTFYVTVAVPRAGTASDLMSADGPAATLWPGTPPPPSRTGAVAPTLDTD